MTQKAQVSATMKEMQDKIYKLEQVLSCYPFHNVNLFFYGSNGVFNGLTQVDFPFSLSGEIKIFMEDSISSIKDEILQLSKCL